MGAYRDLALSLTPWSYVPFDTWNWTPPASPYSQSTYGNPLIPQLGTHLRRPSMVRAESGDTVAAGINLISNGAETVGMGPDFTIAVTVSLEYGLSLPPSNPTTTYPGSQGFLELHMFVGAPGVQPWWDLHETVNGTIGIATWGVWSDEEGVVWNDNPPFGYTKSVWGYYDGDLDASSTGSDRLYVYDTGIPITDLMDGRPHLLVVRTRGAQQVYSEIGPTSTTTWISLSIDGAWRYTSARGPAFGGQAGTSQLRIGGGGLGGENCTGADEMGLWSGHLSDAQIADLWSAWGDIHSWPHPASAIESATGGVSDPDPILRILSEAEVQQAFAGVSDPDPTWIEQPTMGIATAVGILGRAFMGDGTWDGQDPWSSGWKRPGARKWLDMDQDVALVGAPSAGSSSASAALAQDEDEFAGVASGQSSASGALTLHFTLVAEPIVGSSVAYAITIGDLSTLSGGVIAGSAIVTGDLSHGQLEYLVAGSSDGSSLVTGALTVSPYSYIDGNEVGDGDHAPAMGGGGLRRAHFSPKSVGYVNTRPNRQAVGSGTTTAGPGS